MIIIISHFGRCTHTTDNVNVKVPNIFHGRNTSTCNTNCKYVNNNDDDDDHNKYHFNQSRLTLGPTQPPVQQVLGLFPGVGGHKAARAWH